MTGWRCLARSRSRSALPREAGWRPLWAACWVADRGDDGLKTVFDGYITDVDLDLDSDPDHTFLNVSGMDTSVLMSLEEKIATWPDLADSDIVQAIVAGYGVPITADTTATVHQDTDTTIVQRATDIQFVRDLAQRNGLEFYFETDDSGTINAYFRAPQLSGTPQPDLAIQFGDQSNLKHFSAHLNGQRPLNVKATQMDVSANSPNSAQVSDTQLTELGASDANTLIGGPLGSLVTPKDAPAQMLVLGPPTSDATELQTIAQAVRDEAGWLITASGEINSDAYQSVLRPHRLVLVKGAGKSLQRQVLRHPGGARDQPRGRLPAKVRGAAQCARSRWHQSNSAAADQGCPYRGLDDD